MINEEGQLIGIISERDIIRGMSKHAEAVLTLPADQLMTREVKTCSSEDQLVDIMEVMTRQRIRHLPVIENGALHGIVSIGHHRLDIEEAQGLNSWQTGSPRAILSQSGSCLPFPAFRRSWSNSEVLVH